MNVNIVIGNVMGTLGDALTFFNTETGVHYALELHDGDVLNASLDREHVMDLIAFLSTSITSNPASEYFTVTPTQPIEFPDDTEYEDND